MVSTTNSVISTTRLIFVCLFVGVFVPFENFSLIWRRHHYRWRAANFYPSSTPTVIEQWGSLAPHLLWHWTSVYNGHPLNTHTYCRAFGSRPVTTCFYYLGLFRLGLEDTNFRLPDERSNRLRHRRGVYIYYSKITTHFCLMNWLF